MIVQKITPIVMTLCMFMLQFQDKFKSLIKFNCIVIQSSHRQNNLIPDIAFMNISTQIF